MRISPKNPAPPVTSADFTPAGARARRVHALRTWGRTLVVTPEGASAPCAPTPRCSPPDRPAAARCQALRVLLIDAANVVGSRPTGWWRNRAGAAADLVARVRAATATSRLSGPVVVVLEGAARQGAEEGAVDGVEIVHAPGDGDDTLAALAAAATGPVTTVTADRALGDRCRAAGSAVVGPNWLLERLTT